MGMITLSISIPAIGLLSPVPRCPPYTSFGGSYKSQTQRWAYMMHTWKISCSLLAQDASMTNVLLLGQWVSTLPAH